MYRKISRNIIDRMTRPTRVALTRTPPLPTPGTVAEPIKSNHRPETSMDIQISAPLPRKTNSCPPQGETSPASAMRSTIILANSQETSSTPPTTQDRPILRARTNMAAPDLPPPTATSSRSSWSTASTATA